VHRCCNRRPVLQTNRRIRENDETTACLRTAQQVDRNIGRHAGSAEFGWVPRKQAEAACCGDRFAATDPAVAPPLSHFWLRDGHAPEPTQEAKRLARLFWRRPAFARPPAAWTEGEEAALRSGIAQQVAHTRRTALTAAFKADVASGAPADSLKSRLQAQLAELAALSADDDAVACEALGFALQQWHLVAQHVTDRSAAMCFSSGTPRLLYALVE
jgi:hypothetical protein